MGVKIVRAAHAAGRRVLDTGAGPPPPPPDMIVDEIRSLLDLPAGGAGAPSLAVMEHTLTAGYAEALALEAERSRIQRRISEVAAQIAEGNAGDRSSELAALGRRLSATDGNLTRLRGLLESLRQRASRLRAA